VNIAACRRDKNDEKSEKADFGKMIENKNSKHMIMVP